MKLRIWLPIVVLGLAFILLVSNNGALQTVKDGFQSILSPGNAKSTVVEFGGVVDDNLVKNLLSKYDVVVTEVYFASSGFAGTFRADQTEIGDDIVEKVRNTFRRNIEHTKLNNDILAKRFVEHDQSRSDSKSRATGILASLIQEGWLVEDAAKDQAIIYAVRVSGAKDVVEKLRSDPSARSSTSIGDAPLKTVDGVPTIPDYLSPETIVNRALAEARAAGYEKASNIIQARALSPEAKSRGAATFSD